MLLNIYYRIFYKPIVIVLPQNIAQYVYIFTTLHHNVKLYKGLWLVEELGQSDRLSLLRVEGV